MKRLYILTLFLIMVLSCGNNAGNDHAANTLRAKPRQMMLFSGLSKAERAIAYKLDTLFSHMYKSGAFNGSVLVAKAGKILFRKSLGIQDKATNGPLSDTSMFQLASVSKV